MAQKSDHKPFKLWSSFKRPKKKNPVMDGIVIMVCCGVIATVWGPALYKTQLFVILTVVCLMLYVVGEAVSKKGRKDEG